MNDDYRYDQWDTALPSPTSEIVSLPTSLRERLQRAEGQFRMPEMHVHSPARIQELDALLAALPNGVRCVTFEHAEETRNTHEIERKVFGVKVGSQTETTTQTRVIRRRVYFLP